MTLNEIIAYAKEHEIDFDKPVVGSMSLNITVPFEVVECDCSFKKNLMLKVTPLKYLPPCHIAWGVECAVDKEEDEE